MFGRIEKRSTDPERLLPEIQALNKALNHGKNPPPRKALPSPPSSDHRSISAGKARLLEPSKSTMPARCLKETPPEKEKKASSIWSWKALKALSHIRHRRFSCRFSLHVHSIEALPPRFEGFSFVVRWRRRDGDLETQPARAFHGVVEFEETLSYTCSVYGSGNGPHHSAKYEAKYFMLCAAIEGSPQFDLGKHRVDLTRLLPLTLEELAEEKSSGKWTTSFKLSGAAKGAILNVSFGYLVLRDEVSVSDKKKMDPEPLNSRQSRKPVPVDADGTLQAAFHRSHRRFRPTDQEVKVLHEILPSSKPEASAIIDAGRAVESLESDHVELGCSLAAAKSDEKESWISGNGLKDAFENADEDCEFTVIEKGIEFAAKDVADEEEEDAKDLGNSAEFENVEIGQVIEGKHLTHLNTMKLDPHRESSNCDSDVSHILVCESKKQGLSSMDSTFCDHSIVEVKSLGSIHSGCDSAEMLSFSENRPSYVSGKLSKSLSLDESSASVASEFLNMLGIEHSTSGLSSDSDPESPREKLLKQFEKEALAAGGNLLGLDFGNDIGSGTYNEADQLELGDLSEKFELSSLLNAAEAEHQKVADVMDSKLRAKMLEDAEAEALMQEWGLNENLFERSLPCSSEGFGSPIHLSPEGPLDLPSLGEGLGPFVQTKDGGFLRSMSPGLFKNAKNNGSLIMQVSSPVVVPAEMGSGIMDILQGLANVGIEKLSMQAKKLMPLEDITGKTMQQIAWEALPAIEGQEIEEKVKHRKLEVLDGANGGGKKRRHTSSIGEMDSEYVSLDDLAPLAVDKIEALSIEGLRIQSGMSDEETPANSSSQSISKDPTLAEHIAMRGGSIGLEGAAGLQLMDMKDEDGDVDGLMGLSITLDEWMRLDAGIVDEEEQSCSRMTKILAAHHAKSSVFSSEGWKAQRADKGTRRCGFLGNNFTVALMVQLRDPLRNYEPVGTPMLALVQVERVFMPPKPKIYKNVSLDGNSEEDDEPEPAPDEKKKKEEDVPQFKIADVHLAGLKAEPIKKNLWGSTTQQQSGSRWLLASGMGKGNKHPLMKSKPASQSAQLTTTARSGDSLWSISSRSNGPGAKWKEFASLNPPKRNPNVKIFK